MVGALWTCRQDSGGLFFGALIHLDVGYHGVAFCGAFGGERGMLSWRRQMFGTKDYRLLLLIEKGEGRLIAASHYTRFCRTLNVFLSLL